MKRSMLIVALAALVALGVGQGVLAFGPGGQMGGRARLMGRTGVSEVADDLEITGEQRKALTELQIQQMEKSQGARLAHSKLRLELQDLWAEEPLDDEAIQAKEAELVKARLEMVRMGREMTKSVQEVLTPEQLEKVNSKSWGPMGRGGRRGGTQRGMNGMGGMGQGFHPFGCIY